MKKINKNYFRVGSKSLCSVLVTEKLMKKVSKLTYEYKIKLEALLLQNIDDCVKEEWALAYPNGEQESFYAITPHSEQDIINAIGNTHKVMIERVENIFDIGDKDIYSDEVKEGISDLMAKEVNKP